MIVSLAGLPFRVLPDERLTSGERQALETLGDPIDQAESPFELALVDHPPWTSEDRSLFRNYAPMRLEPHEEKLRVSHFYVTAEIDPDSRRAEVWREASEALPLQMVLRTALGCELPRAGGVLVHSAGIVFDQGAVIFFGHSGAGKSTLSALAPFPVLSDELVAVRREEEGFFARATGFWGTLDRQRAPRGRFPVRALVELQKGSELSIAPLEPANALRRLLGVAVAPPAPAVWSQTLAVLGDMAATLPSYAMRWSLSEPPFEKLSRFF